jgi:hypothetical protein
MVERVSNVFPHAHFTTAVAYSGWMSVFMGALPGDESRFGNS